MSKHLKVP